MLQLECIALQPWGASDALADASTKLSGPNEPINLWSSRLSSLCLYLDEESSHRFQFLGSLKYWGLPIAADKIGPIKVKH